MSVSGLVHRGEVLFPIRFSVWSGELVALREERLEIGNGLKPASPVFAPQPVFGCGPKPRAQRERLAPRLLHVSGVIVVRDG